MQRPLDDSPEEGTLASSDYLGQDKNIDHVRSSANHLLSRFKDRLEELRGNNEVTEKLLRMGYDPLVCFEEAIKFFGSEEVKYLAIDGTEFQEDRLDLMVFFVGAFGYSGSIHFNDDGGGAVTSDPPLAGPGSMNLSSAIPISEEYASRVFGESTEGGVDVDANRVPQSLMRLAEYYLALCELRRDQEIKVLLMDRSVSGDIAHISWKMREYIRSGRHYLEGYETELGRVTLIDLELGRMLIPNAELRIPPSRSQFLKFAAMQSLIENGSQSVSSLIKGLGANPERGSKLLKELMEDFGDSFVSKCTSVDETMHLKPEAASFWDRLVAALDSCAGHIFNPRHGEHPLELKVNGNGSGKWINTNDLDYLTLIAIYAILREAWRRNVLLIGIVKDTAANELVKTVLPILEDSGLLRMDSVLPTFESDKMLLQANSIVNAGSIKTPWRTFEYDVCFRTISPWTRIGSGKPEDKRERRSWVKGAFKNVITCERSFVKAYFQLWSSSNDSSVRSHVFIYDRPCYPQYDLAKSAEEVELFLDHEDSVREEIIPAIHFVHDSPISTLVMGILQSMGSEPIPEALGHNYPLFLADKKAKWLVDEAAKACTAAVELEIARSKLDQQVLYEARYRDYRTAVEARRKNRRNNSSSAAVAVKK